MKTVFRGRQDYVPLWREMQEFTDTRNEDTPDEIWFVEHPPVFTMGLNASEEHLLAPGDIPVVQIDRGGQVTFHGPGQLMIYPLIDLRRANVGVRNLVTALEQSVVDLVAEYQVEAVANPKAPGVYVSGDKLASVGLRIRRGSSFHGMALNVDIDLENQSLWLRRIADDRLAPIGNRPATGTDVGEILAAFSAATPP